MTNQNVELNEKATQAKAIIDKANAGAFYDIAFHGKNLAKKSKTNAVIYKHTQGVFRVGVEWKKTRAYQNYIAKKLANGEMIENSKDLWHEASILGKKYRQYKGDPSRQYVVCYTHKNGFKQCKSWYTMNGKTVDYATIENLIYAQTKKDNDGLFFVQLDNIEKIKGIEIK